MSQTLSLRAIASAVIVFFGAPVSAAGLDGVVVAQVQPGSDDHRLAPDTGRGRGTGCARYGDRTGPHHRDN